MLNQLRRDAVEQLQAAQGAPRHIEIHEAAAPRTETPRPASNRRSHSSPAGPHAGTTRRRDRPAARVITLDYLDLYGLRPSIERALRLRHRRACGQPARAQAGRREHCRFPAGLRLPDSGALQRPAGSAAPPRSPRTHRRFQPERRQRSHRGRILRARPELSHAHPRSERRAGGRPGATGRAARASRPSPTSTCPSSTPSTASSAASSPPEPAIAIAAAPAKSTASPCATPPDAPIP